VRRAAAATMAALCLLTGCARTVPGQVAMTTTPLSPDMTCDEFVLLGDRDRVEVVGEILSTQGGGKSTNQAFLLSALAGILCKGAPQVPVKTIIARMKMR
jgi:hypothetical protein